MTVLLDLCLADVLDVAQRVVDGPQLLVLVDLGPASHEALEVQAVGHLEAVVASHTGDGGWLASRVAVACAVLQ